MRKLLSFAALVLMALVAIPSLAVSSEADVKAAYAAWDEAFSKGDAKAVAAFYTEDAVLLPPTHDILKGPAGVETFFAGLFAAGVTGHKLELVDLSGDDKTIVGAAKWSAQGKDANGAPAAFGGIATHAFVRQPAGSLKLRLHTFN